MYNSWRTSFVCFGVFLVALSLALILGDPPQ